MNTRLFLFASLLLSALASYADSTVNTDLCKPPAYWAHRIQGDPDIHALTASRSNQPYFIAIYGENLRVPGLRAHYSCLDGKSLIKPIKNLDIAACDHRSLNFNREARDYASAFNRVMRHARPELLANCTPEAYQGY